MRALARITTLRSRRRKARRSMEIVRTSAQRLSLRCGGRAASGVGPPAGVFCCIARADKAPEGPVDSPGLCGACRRTNGGRRASSTSKRQTRVDRCRNPCGIRASQLPPLRSPAAPSAVIFWARPATYPPNNLLQQLGDYPRDPTVFLAFLGWRASSATPVDMDYKSLEASPGYSIPASVLLSISTVSLQSSLLSIPTRYPQVLIARSYVST
ncbi:hypothetical protein PsYK624_023380 [Phanerochaete sordida]|uniref:Uncharacterized protein n=1 Tax=Phanerochaete sordida TaxID=48140 RepID=A0A9P3G112_9APHY|nr:hypothetical protein PsYK624_023380 [Phanerochaete sordida]